jgi:hypothetical protein
MKKSFNIQELFASQVQTSWKQAHAPPLLVESFPKTPRTQFETSQFGGFHKYKTKQKSYLPSIHIYIENQL